MDETLLHAFRLRLQAELATLAEDDLRGHSSQAVVTLDQQAIGRLSRQDALLNQSMAKAAQSRRAAQETRLRAALARIDDGSFGYCTDCGEDIPPARLDRDPTLPRCISCVRG